MYLQSDGQAESQYAAARKATQDRFGFYQVTIRVLFLVRYTPIIFDVGYYVLFVGGFSYLSADFYRLFVQAITNSHSQGSNPKWSNALSATGGAA